MQDHGERLCINGIMTNGNVPIRVLGAAKEKIWNREGALRKPVATAITRSAIPRQFQRAIN